jgi:hypothetical protein
MQKETYLRLIAFVNFFLRIFPGLAVLAAVVFFVAMTVLISKCKRTKGWVTTKLGAGDEPASPQTSLGSEKFGHLRRAVPVTTLFTFLLLSFLTTSGLSQNPTFLLSHLSFFGSAGRA